MFFRLVKSGQQGLLSRTLKALNSTLPRFYGHQHQIQSRFCRSDNFLHVSRTYPDQSIQSKIIALAFSMAAEIERDLISQRTKEALRFKKEQGIALGRPKGPGKSKLDAFRPEIEGLLANGSTQKFIARRYHTTEANLHNWLKKHGLKTSRQRSVS